MLKVCSYSFSSTQGQWCQDLLNPGFERRVIVTGAIKGYALCVLEFRTQENLNCWPPRSSFAGRKYFVTSVNNTVFIRSFDTLEERTNWLNSQPNPYS